MMKTALLIIQEVRQRMLLPAPATLIGVTDPDVLQLLQLFYATCEELRQARCWTQTKRTHTFTTEVGRSRYPLPQDYFASILSTHWNQTESRRLVGPEPDGDFTVRLYGGAPGSSHYSYRVFGPDEDPATTGGQLELNPTPAAIQTLSFDYIMRTFILPATFVVPTAPKETVTADTDLCVFDYDLVKLGLRAKIIAEDGGEYADAKQEFESKINAAVARYCGSYKGKICGGTKGPAYRIPKGSWI